MKTKKRSLATLYKMVLQNFHLLGREDVKGICIVMACIYPEDSGIAIKTERLTLEEYDRLVRDFNSRNPQHGAKGKRFAKFASHPSWTGKGGY